MEARAFDVGVYVVIGFFILFILMYIGFEELIFEDQIASDVFEAVDSIFLGVCLGCKKIKVKNFKD